MKLLRYPPAKLEAELKAHAGREDELGARLNSELEQLPAENAQQAMEALATR